MNYQLRTKKAFTLIELVVAVALLAMVLAFSGIIFKVSIESYRTAVANAEIMQKLRAITDQLSADFKELPKDGYLILHCEFKSRGEYLGYVPGNFRADRLYYFSTGDFQSWFPPYARSNVARIYFGHDANSLDLLASDRVVSKWNLARDVVLLTPGRSGIDCDNRSYAECKADIPFILNDANTVFSLPIQINLTDADTIRSLLCQNAGWMEIEWTDGTKYQPPNNTLAWFGFLMSRTDGNAPGGIMPRPEYGSIEDKTHLPTYYRASWTPATSRQLWPRALKFTFTLYDSRNIIKGGRMFTHIVYLD